VLKATGLTKSYASPAGGTLPILNGVDLALDRGQFAVVTGPSGSGKSTLLNVLGLLEDADAGDIWLAGEHVTALSRGAKSRARGRLIGFVFQSFLLLPTLTALDNVLLAARYVGSAREPRRRALALLEQVGMAERAAHYPAQLSGGEQQRVAFCRAVLNDPPVLLADEPTGNLDDANGAIILDALRARAREGATVVVVSHRPEIAGGAGPVFWLHAGRLDSSTVKEARA
jgi:putative ABC transport system ATP-binding protein